MVKQYKNPIICSDYSDPDVIRVNDDFFMVASSFNYLPGVPVLHSKNLVDWRVINYVFDKIPFSRFDEVCHGAGAWAPSIRYHEGIYYCIIPFPDEGIYVSQTVDPFGKWSELRCLIKGKGIIDPCPIWINDKCYLVVGFAKSRIGFNSCLGVYEVSKNLSQQLTEYKIVYDGHNDNPTIEGPKFNARNGFYYIMAPAGSVKSGWQVCLRSKEIYGPYESKIVLMQNDTFINGPHQGALLEINDKDDWAFIHFQDCRVYGRIVHLQPVKWVNDWPLCGLVKDELLAGSPVITHPYLLPIKSNYRIPTVDLFQGEMNNLWQTPANRKENQYFVENGLKMKCLFHESGYDKLHLMPNTLTQKIIGFNFDIATKLDASLLKEGDEAGLAFMGEEYAYIGILYENDKYYLIIKNGTFNSEKDHVLLKEEIYEKIVVLQIKFRLPGNFQFGFNGKILKYIFKGTAGRWVGARVGLYSKGVSVDSGFAKYEYFKMKLKKAKEIQYN